MLIHLAHLVWWDTCYIQKDTNLFLMFRRPLPYPLDSGCTFLPGHLMCSQQLHTWVWLLGVRMDADMELTFVLTVNIYWVLLLTFTCCRGTLGMLSITNDRKLLSHLLLQNIYIYICFVSLFSKMRQQFIDIGSDHSILLPLWLCSGVETPSYIWMGAVHLYLCQMTGTNPASQHTISDYLHVQQAVLAT